jgi:hypothetical protein
VNGEWRGDLTVLQRWSGEQDPSVALELRRGKSCLWFILTPPNKAVPSHIEGRVLAEDRAQISL